MHIIRCTVRLPSSLVKVYLCMHLCLLHCTLVSSSSATPTTSSSRAAPTPTTSSSRAAPTPTTSSSRAAPTPTTSSRELPPPPAAAELPERKRYHRGHRTTTNTQRYVMVCCIALALKSYRKMCMQHVYSTHVRDLHKTIHFTCKACMVTQLSFVTCLWNIGVSSLI